MADNDTHPRRATRRDLLFFTRPDLWPTWPFLPLVRRHAGGAMDYGVLFDSVGCGGPTGFSSAVLLSNVFTLPRSLEAILALPREVYDTPEELGLAGWVVD